VELERLDEPSSHDTDHSAASTKAVMSLSAGLRAATRSGVRWYSDSGGPGRENRRDQCLDEAHRESFEECDAHLGQNVGEEFRHDDLPEGEWWYGQPQGDWPK
jgi:hypothetical protein